MSLGDHLTRSAQYAADRGPRAMFLACRDLNASRWPAVWLVRTPCCPKRIVLICPPDLATTMCDLDGCPGVRFGLLYPVTPALASRGSFLLVAIYFPLLVSPPVRRL